MPAKANFTELADGRFICARDAKTAVIDEADGLQICRQSKESLDRLFSRFLTFPETNVIVQIVDRLNLQQLFKFSGHDQQCPNIWGCIETKTNRGCLQHTISLLSGLPVAAFKATCAHEYAHSWLNENLSDERRESLSPDAVEGFCELIAFRLMDAQNEEAQQKLIELNAYTRGHIHLFLAAEKRYGFDDIVDWMKSGIDDRLNGDDLGRIRSIEIARPVSPSVPNAIVSAPEQPSAPDVLMLKGIVWSKNRPLALINDRSFVAKEEGKVRVGKTNVTVRCLDIRQDSVRIQLLGSGEQQELRLKTKP